MTRFEKRFRTKPVLIGMIHLPPLPGFDGCPGIDALIAHALRDLETLEACGFDAVLVENEYDRPHTVKASPEVLEAMTEITAAVVAVTRTALVGCEILLNDPQGSLRAAHAAGADFIRTDYFVDRMTRPEYGEFDVDPDGLIAFRRELGADDVMILADIQVKYATMIEPRSLSESAALARSKHADAVVVTGDQTGMPPSASRLDEAMQGIPVLIGSGLDADNASALLPHCAGAIVGTALMKDGVVDRQLAQELKTAAGS